MTVASIVAGKVAALRAGENGEVRTVKPDITVAEAIRRMRDELVGALVVSEDGTSILGIISDRGIVDALADHGVDVLKDRVRTVMTEGSSPAPLTIAWAQSWRQWSPGGSATFPWSMRRGGFAALSAWATW